MRLQPTPTMHRPSFLIPVLTCCALAISFAPSSSAEEPGLRHYYAVPTAPAPQTIKVDVAIYGGTPGGVATAVQTQRMGKTAALAVFRKHVGGMTSAGLTATDLGKAKAIGGFAAEFFGRVGKWSGFRPSEAEQTFRTMLDEAGAKVFYEHRLRDVVKDGHRITALVFENGHRLEAQMFVDATYEGDLFAKAGVSYHVGREANATYGETINGVQIMKGHQFRFPVDPYKTVGDPKSGLLWGISDEPVAAPGTGDKLIQAYNFRMWLTDAADRRPFPQPAGYDRTRYELLLRYLQSAPENAWKFTYGTGPFQLQKGDSNNAGPVSTDYLAGNYDWPEADHPTRERIFQDHVNYQQGMMWFMANDEAVPATLRERVRSFGLTPTEFPETGGWPHELYVREGRRMISSYIMTEHNCRSTVVADDSVGLASYAMDSHNTRRVIVNGLVRAEGNVEVKVPQPYPISYRAVVPKEEQCSNLLVPVSLSSTHMAFGSIRMEPVFMILGQSAATAAVQAIEGGHSVQKVDYQKLRTRLLTDGQVLDWTAGPSDEKAP
jgi:hypothetical protein